MDDNLIEIFNTTSNGKTIHVQFNQKNCGLYVNNEKVVTEIIKLSYFDKFLAYGASLAIIAQGILAMLSYFGITAP